MAAKEFSIEAVKEFMTNNGGRVKNHQLVTHFKSYLNDPLSKVHNREKFKDFVNELATIKVEEGEKVLVLKKKFRPDGDPVSVLKSSTDLPRAQSEPPNQPPPQPPARDHVDGGTISKVRSEGSLEMKTSIHSADSASVNSLAMSTTSITSTESHGSGKSSQTSTESDPNVSVFSVKERAKHLNRMQSESDMLSNSPPAPKKKDSRFGSRGSGGDDDDSQSSGSSYVTLEPEEREWMLICCKSEYHEMNRILSKNPQLAKFKTFTNTALHWACKNGKPEVIKLVASKAGVNINGRTVIDQMKGDKRSYNFCSYIKQMNGKGYTPLHIAAIHGHEDIIALLVQTYRADPNIRDYSGKKAKQYLKNSASTKAQQLLLTRSLQSKMGSGRSLDDTFMRTMSYRKSHRTRAISSLLQATSNIVRNNTFRSSWDGTADSVRQKTTPESSPPGSNKSSPSTSRKGSFSKDHDLMPPPSAPTRRKKVQSGENFSNDRCEKSMGSRSESDPAITTHSAKTTFI